MRDHPSRAEAPALRRTRLGFTQTQRLLEHFVAGTSARTTAELVGVNRNTATRFFHRLRELIAANLASDAMGAKICNQVEAGAYYFGMRGTALGGVNTPIQVSAFALLERGGRVCAVLLPDLSRETVAAVLKSRIGASAVVFSDHPSIQDALEYVGINQHRVVRSGRPQTHHAHVRGVSNFWSQVERHLRKYNGIPRHRLQLFLTECEWRFNYGSPRKLFSILSGWLRDKR